MNTSSTQFERALEYKNIRRMRAEDKMLDRLERREIAAGAYIGELTREGQTVYYITAGGKYKEGERHQLVALLARRGVIR